MATLADLIADVCSRLDEESRTGELMWSDIAITRWLNEANLRVATELEDIESTDIQSTVAAQAAYTLPTDLVKLARVTVNSLPLRPISIPELNTFEGTANPTTAQQGTPEYFYRWGASIYLFPAPAAAVTNGLALWYFGKPAALVNTTDVPEHDSSLHYLLPLYACYLGYGKDMSRAEARDVYALWQDGLENERQRLSEREGSIELGQIMQVD